MALAEADVQGIVAVIGAPAGAPDFIKATGTFQLRYVTTLPELLELAHLGQLSVVVCAPPEGSAVITCEVARALATTLTPLVVCVRGDVASLRALVACARYPGPLHVAVQDIDVLPRVLTLATRNPLVRSPSADVITYLLPLVRDSLRSVLVAAACCAPWNLPVGVFLRACGVQRKERTLRARLNAAGWPAPFELLGLFLGVHTAHWTELHGCTLRELAAVGGWPTEIAFRQHLRRATGASPSWWRRLGFRRALDWVGARLRDTCADHEPRWQRVDMVKRFATHEVPWLPQNAFAEDERT